MSLPDFTTMAAVKTYLGLTISTDDAEIATLITAYSAGMRTFMNRDITSNSYDIRRSGQSTLSMLMPQYPITAVALLEINGQAIPAQPAWGQPGYYFDDIQIALECYCFHRGISNVHIQYTAGYATVPADLAQACIELVALRYRLRDKLEWSTKSLAGESVTLITKDMPSSVATALKNWRAVAPL